MKKLIGVLILGLVVFLAINRQRVYLRDPIAHVTRDGNAVSGVRVMINYPNDVLLLDKSAGRNRIYLVQHWNLTLGTPTAPMHCVQELACMTDADHATEAKIVAGPHPKWTGSPAVTMTNRQVDFIDEDGVLVAVTLR